MRGLENDDLETQLNIFEDEAITDEAMIADRYDVVNIDMSYPFIILPTWLLTDSNFVIVILNLLLIHRSFLRRYTRKCLIPTLMFGF